MKTGLAVILACLAFNVAAYEATPLGEFKMLKNREGIDLYYRWMQMPAGNQVRQMKAVLEINSDAEDVLRPGTTGFVQPHEDIIRLPGLTVARGYGSLDACF